MTKQTKAVAKFQVSEHRAANHNYFWIYMLMLAALLSLVFLPQAASARDKPAQGRSVERGEYLTTILGCGGCHTEGALEGLPYGEHLAGSKTGIAYSEFDPLTPTAIVFPANLTPHKKYGLGRWSKRDIARAIRNGINHAGGEVITVMPWINYARLHKQDVDDIVNYLKSLRPVAYEIPDPVPEGEPATQPYLRIGIYHFTPAVSNQTPNQ